MMNDAKQQKLTTIVVITHETTHKISCYVSLHIFRSEKHIIWEEYTYFAFIQRNFLCAVKDSEIDIQCACFKLHLVTQNIRHGS